MKNLLALLLLLVCGCAQMQVAQQSKELSALMNGLLGKTREDVVLAIGAPTSTTRVGELEVYQFQKSYGARSQVVMNPNAPLVLAGGRTWEAKDTVTAYFRDGVMVKWDGYVQR